MEKSDTMVPREHGKPLLTAMKLAGRNIIVRYVISENNLSVSGVASWFEEMGYLSHRHRFSDIHIRERKVNDILQLLAQYLPSLF